MSKLIRVTSNDAVKLAYYLMAIDGKISLSEKKYLKEIAEGFGVFDVNIWQSVVERTDVILDMTGELKIIYNLIVDEVDKIIEDNASKQSNISQDDFIDYGINSNFLLWNLLTMAIKDLDYSENEKKLIDYIAKKLNIDKNILFEMDNSIRTLYSIQNELNWIEKNIEYHSESSKLKKELEKRMSVVETSIKLFFDDDM